MRTRNQSKQQQPPQSPPRAPCTSRTAVPRLVKCASSCTSKEKKKLDRHLQCFDSETTAEKGSKGKDFSCNTSIPGTIFPEENFEVENDSFDPLLKEDDTEGSDWEDGNIPFSGSRDLLRGVVVEFDDSPSSSSKRKPIRRASAEDKELAELVHKAHLLCLLARGRLVDIACSDLLIQASLLSLLPTYLLKIAQIPELTANALAPLVNWFHDNFHAENTTPPERSFNSNLAFALENHRGTAEEVVALSVALFRAMNLTARFVSILDVASLKPEADMSGSSSQDATRQETGVFNSSTLMVTWPRQASVSPVRSSSQQSGLKSDIAHGSSHRSACQTRESSKSSWFKDIPGTARLNDNILKSSTSVGTSDSSDAGRTKKAEVSKRKGDLEFELQLEMALSATATATGVYDRNLISELKDLPSSSSNLSLLLNRYKKLKTEESPVSSQGISTAIGSRKAGPPLYWAEVFCNGENSTGKWVHVDVLNAIIDGAEKVEAATAACKRTLRYVVAFAGSGAKDVTRRYCMKWYKIASKRINSQWWDAVLTPLMKLERDATGDMVPLGIRPEMASNELEKVRALEISGSVEASMDGTIKSLNKESLPNRARLSEKLDSEVSKQHGTNIKYESSIPRVASRNSLEDMELQTRALTEPLPTNQQAFKNHHLYAIERWLTKYQILYPKGPILGYCSGYPVYPRTCVQMLQTKQRWIQEGLQIKANESPAKVVKRSVKLSKAHAFEPGACEEDDSGGSIALYGKWQTEPLDLPHAVNGIVPKNERGQVDAWSEKCLPHGTVHLRFPRVVPVAKRLEIDFAPAMVGFEFRNGRSFPVYEGIVVCSEFKDAIMEAYAEEEERREAVEKKQNEAEALSRWYQLLSSMITRQRLKDTYGDGSTSETPDYLNQKGDTGGVQINNHGDHTITYKSLQGYVRVTEGHEHIFPTDDQSFDEESSVRTKRCPCGFLVQVEEF